MHMITLLAQCEYLQFQALIHQANKMALLNQIDDSSKIRRPIHFLKHWLLA